MEFPMSSFKIKLVKALVTTNTPPSHPPPLLPTKKKKTKQTKYKKKPLLKSGWIISDPH